VVYVAREFVVSAQLAEVTDYLKDFSHAEDWDPGTVRCVRTDSGEIKVGSTWHNVSRFRGRTTELDYRLTTVSEDRLTFVGNNRTATSTDDMTFRVAGTGTSVTYRATIRFHGLAKLADPLMKRIFNRIADETVDQMTRVLNAL
jgi:carbon monoxide dehydrogenase subunit G